LPITYIGHKSGEKKVFVLDDLNDFKDFDEKSRIMIYVYNKKENLAVLVEKWKEFVKCKLLGICFVNPESILERKWCIFPHTHDKICDENSLELGLKSMFETVEANS